MANPDALGGANLTTNVGGTRYNSMQFELRKRLTNSARNGERGTGIGD